MNFTGYQFRQHNSPSTKTFTLEVFSSGDEKVEAMNLSDKAVGWPLTRPGGAFGSLIEKNPEEVTGDADTVREVGRWLAETQPHQFV